MRLRHVAFLILAALLPVGARAENSFPKISIRDGKLYSGEEELLLVSVGYAHYRPGQGKDDIAQYKGHGYDLIELDMQRIKEAGFNTVRTWHLPDRKYVELAQKHGLWIVGGIWTPREIDLASELQTEQAVRSVAALARTYAKFPNVAMLTINNEPEPGLLLRQDSAKVTAYFQRLADTARQNCPGVPVTFSNWPNAGFLDPSPWDVVSFNIYASVTPKFQAPMGYRGYIESVRKRASAGKPFYVSEFGFYCPVPELNPKDRYGCYWVPSKEKQAELLVRDADLVYQEKAIGAVLMQWMDNWWLSEEFGSPGIVKPEKGYVNKEVHDMECHEWAGILEFEGEDIRGTPRPAFFAVQKANQAILTEPDSQVIYPGEVPVCAYLTERVARLELVIDGDRPASFTKTTAHWFRKKVPVSTTELARHEIILRAYDSEEKLLSETRRTAWTGPDTGLPTLDITEEKDTDNRVYFRFALKDGSGKPIPDVGVRWGALDVVSWQEWAGAGKTGQNGIFRLKRPAPSSCLLISGGYDFKRGEFERKIADLYIYRQ